MRTIRGFEVSILFQKCALLIWGEYKVGGAGKIKEYTADMNTLKELDTPIHF